LNLAAERLMSIACAMLILPVLCSPVQAQTSIMLVATGSSLPEPLYLLWNEEYHRAHAETQLRYLPEGTGESATRILAGAGDLGGGDAPIPEKQLKGAAHPVVELPSVLIGIAIVYNVPGAASLRLSGPVLANIFLGKTTSWNDPEIAKLNPELHLSALPIKVIHRTDGKGSSYIFSDYLARISADFLTKAGRSVSPKWPAGVGINRTEDLLDKVRKTPGSIGYTELNWAEKSGLPMAHLRNAAGEFIKPSVASIADAASALAGKMTEDFRVSLVNAPGKASYPIASFTWLYVPERAQDPARGQAVAEYLKWVYSAGQELAREHGYAPLPPAVLEKVRAKAAMVR